MKKNITFVHSRMIMGGAEVVLLRLFEALLKDDIHFNLILFKHGGELFDSLPDDVNVQFVDIIELKDYLKNLNLIGFLKGVYCRLRIRLSSTYEEECAWLNKICTPFSDISSQCVISFTPHNFMCLDMVSHCNSQCKIVWIHDCMFDSVDEQKYNEALRRYDVIICVSNTVKDYFSQRFPIIADKTVVIYNLIDKDLIIEQSKETPLTSLKSTSLLTVGRLASEKGQIIIPYILRKLLDNNYDVYWYLVGEGVLREQLEILINELSLEGRLILLGNQMNPFPYMRQCDIYVQPSRHEGFCTTTNEARILCKPIVASNIPSMQEQFVNGKTALLAELNVDSFYLAIKYLLDNPQIQNEFSENLKSLEIDNESELQKLYCFMK